SRSASAVVTDALTRATAFRFRYKRCADARPEAALRRSVREGDGAPHVPARAAVRRGAHPPARPAHPAAAARHAGAPAGATAGGAGSEDRALRVAARGDGGWEDLRPARGGGAAAARVHADLLAGRGEGEGAGAAAVGVHGGGVGRARPGGVGRPHGSADALEPRAVFDAGAAG